MAEADWIPARWDAPPWVHAGSTTRAGGYSRGLYAACNLAGHVGDDPRTVDANRIELTRRLLLPSRPRWLHQVHGVELVCTDTCAGEPTADASYTRSHGIVCAVLTADCVPLLICNRSGTLAAAVHAGWRGLCAGLIASAVATLRRFDTELLAWIGPHIRPPHYPVGEEVRAACRHALGADALQAFTAAPGGRWYADLELLTTLALRQAGVAEWYGCGCCTYADDQRFYSYRRDGATGRMASLIWLDPPAG